MLEPAPRLGTRFEEALVFAADAHSRQRRKGSGVPYVAHLLAVAAIVLEHGGNEDEAIAALLHDAIEDQGGPAMEARMLARFGPEVTRIVQGCTDTGEVPKPPWRARKEQHLAHVRASACASTLLVCAADKLHNMRSVSGDLRRVGGVVWTRFTGGREGTLWYYERFVEVLDERQSLDRRLGPLVEELRRVLRELNSLARDLE